MSDKKFHAAALKNLRKIIGITQKELADMLGVSVPTVIAIENQHNRITKSMNNRISVATGATCLHTTFKKGVASVNPFKGGEVRSVYTNVKFTREVFDEHTSGVQEVHASYLTKECLDKMKSQVESLFAAASTKGKGKGQKLRLPVLITSFGEWVEQISDALSLNMEARQLLYFQVTKDTVDQLDEVAKREGKSRSQLQEEAVRELVASTRRKPARATAKAQ